MGSSIFNQFGRNTQQNNPIQMFRQFMDFKNGFTGDPKAKVQEMLNTGQMTQEQFNKLGGMAKDFQSVLSMLK